MMGYRIRYASLSPPLAMCGNAQQCDNGTIHVFYGCLPIGQGPHNSWRGGVRETHTNAGRHATSQMASPTCGLYESSVYMPDSASPSQGDSNGGASSSLPASGIPGHV